MLLTRVLSPGPASINHFKTMPGLLRAPPVETPFISHYAEFLFHPAPFAKRPYVLYATMPFSGQGEEGEARRGVKGSGREKGSSS